MDNTNDLSISLGLDPTGLRSGLTEAERLVESSSQRIRSSIERIGNLGQQLAGLGATMTASLTVPIVGLATASIKAYGDIQALQKGLEAVAGSASYANKQFDDLKEVAKLPGLGLQEAVKGSINLQAIGLTADKSKEILLQFGNAIASVGKGRVEFDRAIYGITQLANTEFPLGEDLNIVADALPQVRTLLKDTFGKTRSDDLAKMGVTSKMVLDTILKGLTDLPRVNGGIKNAFENLGDSIQQNLARIGERIDKAFNISGVIDKLTNALDSAITYFEDLTPATQKVILVLAGLTAVAGPLILAVGGFLALLPTLIAGVGALGTAFTFLTGPIGLAIVAITAIAGSLIYYYATAEDATDRQERLNNALAKATINAKNETEELKKLYAITQDENKSKEEKLKVVDQLQKQYPAYFGNLTDEAILAGKAGTAYKNLTIDITNASRARVAQAELDKRNSRRLEEDLDLQNKLSKNLRDYNNAQDTYTNLGTGGSRTSKELIKQRALEERKELQKIGIQRVSDRIKEDKNLLSIIGDGIDAVTKLEVSGIEGTGKAKEEAKKKADKYVYAKGSEGYYEAEIARLEELKKRAQFDSDVWRELGKQIEAYQELLDPKEIEPVKIKSAGFMDNLGNEFKTYVDLMQAQSERLNKVLNFSVPQILSNSQKAFIENAQFMAEWTENLNKSLNSLITNSISSGLTELFSGIGNAIGEGGNVISAIGNGLLSAFSGFLSDMGKMLIEYGTLAIAKGTLDMIIQTGGYQAIAAGIAAIAVGAALSIAGGALGSRANKGMSGNISSSAGVSSGNNYSGSYIQGGSFQGGEIKLRLEGRDAVALINRNVIEQDRLNAG